MKFIKSSALALVLMAFPAAAQQQQMPCAPRDAVAKGLAKHGEKVVLRGIVNDTDMLEIWLDENDGSFSVIFTKPPGTASCMVAAGVGMGYVVNAPAPKPGSKS